MQGGFLEPFAPLSLPCRAAGQPPGAARRLRPRAKGYYYLATINSLILLDIQSGLIAKCKLLPVINHLMLITEYE